MHMTSWALEAEQYLLAPTFANRLALQLRCKQSELAGVGPSLLIWANAWKMWNQNVLSYCILLVSLLMFCWNPFRCFRLLLAQRHFSYHFFPDISCCGYSWNCSCTQESRKSSRSNFQTNSWQKYRMIQAWLLGPFFQNMLAEESVFPYIKHEPNRVTCGFWRDFIPVITSQLRCKGKTPNLFAMDRWWIWLRVQDANVAAWAQQSSKTGDAVYHRLFLCDDFQKSMS